MARSTPDWQFERNPKIVHKTITGFGERKQPTKAEMRAETACAKGMTDKNRTPLQQEAYEKAMRSKV